MAWERNEMWRSSNEHRRTSATLLRLFKIQLLLLTAWKWKLMRRFCLQFFLYRFCFGSCCNVSLCGKEVKIQANKIIKSVSLIQYGCSHYMPLSVYKKAYICSACGSRIQAISFFIASFFRWLYHCSIEIFAFENISCYYIYTMIFFSFCLLIQIDPSYCSLNFDVGFVFESKKDQMMKICYVFDAMQTKLFRSNP